MGRKKKAEKGEQLDLIDIAPENAKAIIAAAKIYKRAQTARLTALKNEIEQKQKVLALVIEANLTPLKDGVIRFKCGEFTISATPQGFLIKVKEEGEPKN